MLEDWIVRIQSAVTLADSEPEPDAVVARGPIRRYVRAHPHPRDIALVVEVADTSLPEDRTLKGRVYARARIPVYRIINLVENKVEVYTQPKGGKSPAYRECDEYGVKDDVPVIIDGDEIGEIAVQDLLP